MYAKGRRAWGECARSGRRMLLKDMVADGYYPDLIVDPAWRDEFHPQEHLPAIHDPTTLYRPAPTNLPAPTAVELIVEPDAQDNVGVMYVLAPEVGVPWQVSEDGAVFTPIAQDTYANQIEWFPELQRWIAVGDEIRISDDGLVWVQVTTGISALWSTIAYAPVLGSQGTLLAANEDGGLYRSIDGGLTWQECATYDPEPFVTSAWDQEVEKFIVIHSLGSGNIIRAQTSLDGNTFARTNNFTPFAETADMVANNVGRYIAMRDIGQVLYTDDAENWIIGATPPGTAENSIDFGLGLFMVNGLSGTSRIVQRSADGVAAFTTSTVAVGAPNGNPMQVKCDPTRNQWWYVTDSRLFRSNDATGSAWTQILTGTVLFRLGVRDLL